MPDTEKQFANYVKTSGYKYIRLCGPTGQEIAAKVLKRKQRKARKAWKIKFGTDWKLFVLINNFVVGDILNFKFVNKEESNIMKIIKKN
jgi:hypothetical protein